MYFSTQRHKKKHTLKLNKVKQLNIYLCLESRARGMQLIEEGSCEKSNISLKPLVTPFEINPGG